MKFYWIRLIRDSRQEKVIANYVWHLNTEVLDFYFFSQ